MVIRVVWAEAEDEAQLRSGLERRPADLLGATGGTTADGRLVAVVRAAGDGGPSDLPGVVRETDDLEVVGGGLVGAAGYLEIIEGRTPDRARFMALERRIEAGYARERPDFLGSVILWWPDGVWLEAASFRSEAETLAADEKGLSRPLAALVSEWEAVAGVSSTLSVVAPWRLGSEWLDGRP